MFNFWNFARHFQVFVGDYTPIVVDVGGCVIRTFTSSCFQGISGSLFWFCWLLCNSFPIGGCLFPNYNYPLEVIGMGFTPDSIDSLIAICCISDHRISLQYLHYGLRIDQCLFLPLFPGQNLFRGKTCRLGKKDVGSSMIPSVSPITLESP